MKIICIGRNYVNHIQELNNEVPDEPVIFLKPDSSVLPKNQPFFIPPFSQDIHYETEVVIRIEKVGKYISEKFAHKYYSEFTLGIDFTARDLQHQLKSKGLPWEKAKGFDGSCFVSDLWLPISDFDAHKIPFSLYKNSVKVQDATTEQMIFKIHRIISYVSQFFTLKIGDLLFTGTPEGVGQVLAEDELDGYVGNLQVFHLKIK